MDVLYELYHSLGDVTSSHPLLVLFFINTFLGFIRIWQSLQIGNWEPYSVLAVFLGCTWVLALRSLCQPGSSRAFSAGVFFSWQSDTSLVFSDRTAVKKAIAQQGIDGLALHTRQTKGC